MIDSQISTSTAEIRSYDGHIWKTPGDASASTSDDVEKRTIKEKPTKRRQYRARLIEEGVGGSRRVRQPGVTAMEVQVAQSRVSPTESARTSYGGIRMP